MICIEFLSREISTNENIKGIKIYDIEIKQTLFADDASFLVDNDRKSFETLVHTLEKFGNISGLKLNISKCIVLKLGNIKSKDIKYCTNKRFIWTSISAKTLGITFYNDFENTTKYNIADKILEFENCLERWKKWKLSLIGKITVLKTFAIPKLVYPLTVLSNPNDEVIKQLKLKMFSFLWNGKPDKISRTQIIQDYKYGGLRMIDIDSFVDGLKSTWVKRILYQRESNISIVYKAMLKMFGSEAIFEGNFKFKDIDKMRIKSSFLTNILQAWSKVNYVDMVENLGKETIWNNSNIKNNNQEMFFYKSWYDRGIKYIEHLYNYIERTFYNFQTFKDLYDIEEGDFLKYNMLIKSIPTAWKERLIDENINYARRTTLIVKLNEKLKFSKFFYVKLVEAKRPLNKQVIKWNEDFSDNTIDWKTIFIQPLKVTIDTKLRDFQYKYLMRIIPNNQYLLKCGLTTHSLCDFCSMHIETNKHLFWDCNVVQELWHNIRLWLQNKLDINNLPDFSYQGISLNTNKWLLDTKINNNINFIVLLTKYYIFSKKLQGDIPKINSFLSYFESRLKIEEMISEIKNNYAQFIVTWDKFLRIVEQT